MEPEKAAGPLALATGWQEPRGGLSPPHQLLAQGGEGLLLGPLHSHRADLQLRRGGSEREPLEDGEPQGCGLGRRQLLHQLLQGGPGEGGLQRGLSDGSRQLLKQGGLTGGGSIKAGVAERPGALLVLTAGDAHQADAIAQVVLQGPGDAAAQIGRCRLSSSAAGSRADQGFTGHLDQILPLNQREEAPGGGGSQGISQGQVLQHQSLASLEGRTAEKRGPLLAAGGGSGGSHLRDGGEPHPHRPAAVPGQGRPPGGAWPDP